MMTTQLTPDQQEASQKILDFLYSNEKFFYLFGPAGSGKTFLLKHIIENVLPTFQNSAKVLNISPINGVAITASTHKALGVLSSSFDDVTNIPITEGTVYQFFNVTVKDDYETGESNLVFNDFDSNVFEDYNLIIVDECSMLPSEFINHIQRISGTFKVIFVGDNHQLSPVNESLAIRIWNNVPKECTAVLSSSVRNKNQIKLKEACSILRDFVNSTEKGKEDKVSLSTAKGVIEYLDDDKAIDWLSKVDYASNRVLCYTNYKANKYSKLIHTLKNKSGEDRLKEGNVYIVNSTMYVPKSRKCFYSDEEVQLISMGKTKFESFDGTRFYLPYCNAEIASVSNPSKKATVQLVKDSQFFRTAMNMAATEKNWGAYFYLKNNFIDLRDPYACTIHKAQGSTFDEVLIDLASFRSCTSLEDAARLLYVAFSRAKNKVYLYGKLPKKIGEISNGG